MRFVWVLLQLHLGMSGDALASLIDASPFGGRAGPTFNLTAYGAVGESLSECGFPRASWVGV